MNASKRIAVWTITLDSAPDRLWPHLVELLDYVERSRAAGFVLEQRRQQHLAAHVLKRVSLSAEWGIPPKAWTFAVTPNGKPFVTGPAMLYFSLSHCEGMVACAVSKDLEIGIDIESVASASLLESDDQYRQCCAPEERAWLYDLPVSERPTGALRLWTLKEALVKATGRGLSQPFADIAFRFDPLRVTLRNPGLGSARLWRFDQRLIGRGYLLALAWRCQTGSETLVTVHESCLERLLAQAQIY